MSTIRRQMDDDWRGMVDSARELSDWKHYVRSYPWVSLGVAAAVGFLLVPQRLKVMSPDVETLTELAKSNRLIVTQDMEAHAQPSLLKSALTMIASSVVRSGAALAGQHISRLLAEREAAQGVATHEESHF
jgi:hypothetical protein